MTVISNSYTPDEVYKTFSNPDNNPANDLRESPGFDNTMRREGYFNEPGNLTTDDDEPKKNVYIHYTNRKGIVGIASTKTIYPNKKYKVYLTKSLFTEKEAEQILFLNQATHKGKGKYMVMFKVDPDQDMSIKKDPSSMYEYISTPGNLKIRNNNLIYIGTNLKGSGK